ncbi:hypothetical protein [Actinomadura violacea]|uniref:Uncharacterized protein n=1 Tax=Actinomadura violacea TaxID=2819934 RepID=A0ABS3RP76_9ACTN|nr:hypothetical protein [Actinomadura violacea]MBO2458549.1 hypothetical protein [Actinomadura violacea]
MKFSHLVGGAVVVATICVTPGYALAAQGDAGTSRAGDAYSTGIKTKYGRLTLKFPHANDQTKAEAKKLLAKIASSPGGVATPKLDPPAQPIHGSQGDYEFSDANGTFNIRYNRPYSTVNWGYRISTDLLAIAVSQVDEWGMTYQVNDGPVQKNAPHVEVPWYWFHGTMKPLHDNDILDYADEFQFTVYVAGQVGQADINIGGHVVTLP